MKTDKKTIIWMHSHFLYWMGGTKFIFEVVKRISKKSPVVMLVENASSDSIKKYKAIDVKVINLNKLTSISLIYWATFPYQIVNDLILVKSSIQKLKLNKDNTILVSNMFPMNLIAYFTGFNHIQYCFEPFAFFHDKEFIKNFKPIKRFFINILSSLYGWLDILATKKAQKVVTLNNTTKKTIKMIYGVDSTLSFAGIDTKHFYPHVDKSLTKQYSDKNLIIHSTDYSPVKGTDKMLKIFAVVKKTTPNAHLLITSTIVNDSELNKLKSLSDSLGISESVEFLGFVDYDVLPQLYSLSKVLVQCSYSTLSGTTSMALPVKEAMACGTPAIRFPILGEDVVDGKNGFLVDPRDTKKMVSRIIEILKMNKVKYDKFSTEARKSILGRYDWDKTSDIIYQEIKT